MEFAYLLTGNTTMLARKYQVGETANIGVPMIQPGAGEAGPMQGGVTTLDNMVGVMLDTVTYNTAQNADSSTPEALGTICISPNAVWRAKLSGGAASDTLLTALTVTTESTDGLTITTASSWSTPEYLEGVAWGYAGANAAPEAKRKLTGTSGTAATMDVAFAADIAVGDTFQRAPLWPLENHTITLTTELNQVRADVAVAVNTGAMICVELDLRDRSLAGDGASAVLLWSANHILAGVLA